jgi:hypothetical protein
MTAVAAPRVASLFTWFLRDWCVDERVAEAVTDGGPLGVTRVTSVAALSLSYGGLLRQESKYVMRSADFVDAICLIRSTGMEKDSPVADVVGRIPCPDEIRMMNRL